MLQRVSRAIAYGFRCPLKVRRLLKVEAGDRLDFMLEEEGRVVLRAGVADAGDLKGLLHRPGRRAVSIDEMNAAIARQGRRKP